MYQISKRLTMVGAFLGLAWRILLPQESTKAANTLQTDTPTTQKIINQNNKIEANGRVLVIQKWK
ncbi:hypothetical protein [Bombilactobacillus mellis]|uniref:hypothetical protein n=1 Tax=Bombilactobacillus mellis TaxID=1218508 RepID=UPI002246B47F|nr:hypothetical protein [Bombilactobacillus mellis]MCX0279258.1 hypothetical protein [Bombilactobacillus mellis]